jgi:hypothetical protein
MSRLIYTLNDGYGIQCFSTWEALSKWLFVLRGRHAGSEDTGYQNGLFFDTDNPTVNGAHEHNTTATAHRVKQVLRAGYQCTLIDGADRHPQHITITPAMLNTAKDMDVEWRRMQAWELDNAPRTVEEWENQRA